MYAASAGSAQVCRFVRPGGTRGKLSVTFNRRRPSGQSSLLSEPDSKHYFLSGARLRLLQTSSLLLRSYEVASWKLRPIGPSAGSADADGLVVGSLSHRSKPTRSRTE